MPHPAIAALDNALGPLGSSQGVGEDVILRRPIGTGTSQQFIPIKCRAAITPLRDEQISVGVTQTELNFVISPTQINNSQWPGGTTPALPPFNIDQRVPRAQADDMIVRAKKRTITQVVDRWLGNELVRIEGRITG